MAAIVGRTAFAVMLRNTACRVDNVRASYVQTLNRKLGFEAAAAKRVEACGWVLFIGPDPLNAHVVLLSRTEAGNLTTAACSRRSADALCKIKFMRRFVQESRVRWGRRWAGKSSGWVGWGAGAGEGEGERADADVGGARAGMWMPPA